MYFNYFIGSTSKLSPNIQYTCIKDYSIYKSDQKYFRHQCPKWSLKFHITLEQNNWWNEDYSKPSGVIGNWKIRDGDSVWDNGNFEWGEKGN